MNRYELFSCLGDFLWLFRARGFFDRESNNFNAHQSATNHRPVFCVPYIASPIITTDSLLSSSGVGGLSNQIGFRF